MAGPKWSKEEDKVLIRLHATGKSLNAIAREMGRGASTTSAHAHTLGLSWDRSQTVNAVIARQADAASLRATLELQLLEDAARLRKQLFKSAKVYNFGGKDNTFAEQKINQPSFRDQLDIMKATTIAVQHSIKIAEHDVSTGTEAAIGMLDRVAEGINVAALDLAIEEATRATD